MPRRKTPVLADLQPIIESAFERRASLSEAEIEGSLREMVETVVAALESGKARVAEPNSDGTWRVNEWLKKAVLLSFRLNDNEIMRGGDRGLSSPAPGVGPWYDKVPNKFGDWTGNDFRGAGFRAVPGSVVRRALSSAGTSS